MNCKPGDLAIIILGPSDMSPHIGKIVKVIDLAFPNHPLGPIWNIELSRPVEVFSYKRNLELIDRTGSATRCHCLDAWLRPIRPDAEDLDTQTEAAILNPRVLEPA